MSERIKDIKYRWVHGWGSINPVQAETDIAYLLGEVERFMEGVGIFDQAMKIAQNNSRERIEENTRLRDTIIKPLVEWIDKWDCECDSYMGVTCGLCLNRNLVESARKEIMK